MLYLIGLGLGDAQDITVKGLEAVRRCRRVYLEAYTSVLPVGKEALVGAEASPRGRLPPAAGAVPPAQPNPQACLSDPFRRIPGSLRIWGERDP